MRKLAVVTLLALGCSGSSRWAYRPTAATALADAPATIDGHAAARYQLAHGDVELTTVGIHDEKPPGERKQPMVHLRMIVHNGDQGVWTVSPFEQVAFVGGPTREAPRFALCDGQDVAPAVLLPGETRTLDLYYLLPPGPRPKTLPPVDVDWRVRTPAAVIARATSDFEAFQVPRPVIVLPPPDPRKLARALDGAPSDRSRIDRGAALPPPARGDIAGGLGH